MLTNIIKIILSYSVISTPIERAVPSTTFIAASRLKAFKSGSFFSAIADTWALVNFPTLALFGVAEPLANFNSFLIRAETGEIFRIKSKVLY